MYKQAQRNYLEADNKLRELLLKEQLYKDQINQFEKLLEEKNDMITIVKFENEQLKITTKNKERELLNIQEAKVESRSRGASYKFDQISQSVETNINSKFGEVICTVKEDARLNAQKILKNSKHYLDEQIQTDFILEPISMKLKSELSNSEQKVKIIKKSSENKQKRKYKAYGLKDRTREFDVSSFNSTDRRNRKIVIKYEHKFLKA